MDEEHQFIRTSRGRMEEEGHGCSTWAQWCLYALINSPTSYSQKMNTSSRIFHESAHQFIRTSRGRMKLNNPHYNFLQGPYELNNHNLLIRLSSLQYQHTLQTKDSVQIHQRK
jgi:hypothetical protein